jgi:ribosomal protein S18 acetylase RimI-like enzyme
MLFEAFFWRSDQPRPSQAQFSKNSEFQKISRDWGRTGDRAIIAEQDSEPVGAAWFRFWNDAEHSYGYVDSATPELGIGVRADQRGRGVGRKLLRALLDQAREDKIPQISLSVEPDNLSLWLYKSEGFTKVGEYGNAITMVKKL